MDKVYVLAKFLGEDKDDIEEASWDESTFTVGRHDEYMVLTVEEADERAKEYIQDSLWAFNAWFLAGYTGLDQTIFEALSEKYESGNDAILSLVEKFGGLDGLVEEAISADGRGHFLSHYDGDEHEFVYRNQMFYIYRVS